MANTSVQLKRFLESKKFTSSSSIIVFSGAGMSAESGIDTFRDQGGLWEKHPIEEVATPDAWRANPQKVLEFYNMRRRQLIKVSPNEAHITIAKLELTFDLRVITQNIDDLHERAGSKALLHLHGELRKSRSSVNDSLVYDIEGSELAWGDQCEIGSQLRPHVVWFGEMVPAMDQAIPLVQNCDLLIVIGSSLNVYPAASLVQLVGDHCGVVVIDPGQPNFEAHPRLFHLKEKAVEGMRKLSEVIKSF